MTLAQSLTEYSEKAPEKFHRWIELEDKKEQVIRAVEEGSPEFPNRLFSFISTALSISNDEMQSLPWQEIISAFILISTKNAPRISIPLIVQSDRKKREADAWDYEGRSWHLYSHLFAKTYGWTLEYIANLDVDDALAKIQEILTQNQLDREFQWAMSEVAYPYNKNTKQSEFHALDRPAWMRPKVAAPKKTKLLKAHMPVGNVEYTSEENKPQEIKSK